MDQFVRAMTSNSKYDDLFTAAKNHNYLLVKKLITVEGLNPNQQDEKGNTALFYAADVGEINAIGYSLSPEGLETVKVLIENGANPDMPNREGQTVLEIAKNLVTAGGEHNTYLLLASKLYGNNTTRLKDRLDYIERKYNPDPFFDSMETKNQNENRIKDNISKDNVIIASLFGFIFLLPPILTLYFTWTDLFALSSDWLWIDNSIVVITFLLSSSTIWILFKEKVFKSFILLFLPSFVSCLLYFSIVISFFHLDVRYWIKKHYYMQSSFQKELENPWVQRGFYQDFFIEESGNKLRRDIELLDQISFGLKPNTNWNDLGKGFGLDTYAKQGLTCYISFRELNYSNEDIFSRPGGIWILFSLALAESNPDLLGLNEFPEALRKKYINVDQDEYFRIGILNDSYMKILYNSIIKNISNTNPIELELSIFILTQIPVNIDDDNFELLLNQWISYKPFYKKELRFLFNIRRSLRKKFAAEANIHNPVQISLQDSEAEEDWNLIKPFLISLGYPIIKGNEIKIYFNRKSIYLKDKKVYRTKPVQKTRTITRTVSNYGSQVKYRTETKTETYTDYVSDGFDIIPTYLFTISFPGLLPDKEETPLCGMLSDCYLNANGEPTIPVDAYLRGETWIYALPKVLVCKIGCDGK